MTTTTAASPSRSRNPLVAMADVIRRQPKPVRVGLLALGVVLLYALPLLDPPYISPSGSDFGAVLFQVSVYVLVALGLNVVLGYAGLLDLGYVGFYLIGAYTVAVLGSLHGQLPLLLLLPIAACVALA